MGYSQGIEAMMNIKVPERAEYLRLIWGELHRMHSHLLYLGLMADAFGFENLFMQIWRSREKVLDAMEATTGGRIMLTVCKIGGVRKDIDKAGFDFILKSIAEVKAEMKEIMPAMIKDYSVKHRMVGVGVINEKQARDLGAVGPVLRASGVAYDLRATGYSAYKNVGFQPIVYKTGDVYARTMVRIDEVYQSIAMINEAIAKIPSGELSAPAKGFPTGEVLSRLEQPRGEVIYYIKVLFIFE